jgi:exonuclease III
VRLALVLCAGLWLAGTALAQPARIIIDGDFADWTEDHLVHSDPIGDGGSGIDLGRLWVTTHDAFLLMSFEMGTEINLQDFNNLRLYIDTDGDVSTGVSVHGIGAEIEWHFGLRTGFAHLPQGMASIQHRHLGLFTAPTVTSQRFELAISLDAEFASIPLFSGDTLRFVLRAGEFGDVLPDAPGGVEVVLDRIALPRAPVVLERHDPDHLRLVSYNVLNDGLFDPVREFNFRRILRTLNPDVVSIQEVYNHEDDQIAARMEELLPSAPGERWHVSGVGPPGLRRSDVYLASRYPIAYSEAICRVATSPLTCNGAFRLDLSERYLENLFLIVAHTPCCQSNTTRQMEIDQMMAHLRDARTDGRLPEGTPFAITGDLNLVGLRQQLHTLLTGEIVDTLQYGPRFRPDWDGSDLADAIPPTTGMPAAFTWYDETSSFHPGRLDFVIYSDAVASVAHRFVLFTPGLVAAELSAYELLAVDTPRASDHLPVVTDFVLPLRTTGMEAPAVPGFFRIESAYPNPFRDEVRIRFLLDRDAWVEVEVVDLLGRVVHRVAGEHRQRGAHEVRIEGDALPAGQYLIRMRAGTEERVLRFARTP